MVSLPAQARYLGWLVLEFSETHSFTPANRFYLTTLARFVAKHLARLSTPSDLVFTVRQMNIILQAPQDLLAAKTESALFNAFIEVMAHLKR